MFKNEATVHASSISMKTRSVNQLKKRTFTTFTSSIVTSSSLSSMFNMTTFSFIQIYTTLLTASSTFILLHYFSDLQTILGLLTSLITEYQHSSSSSSSFSLQTSLSSSSSLLFSSSSQRTHSVTSSSATFVLLLLSSSINTNTNFST